MAGGSEDQVGETQNIMKDCCTLSCNWASGKAPLAPSRGFSLALSQKRHLCIGVQEVIRDLLAADFHSRNI